MRTLGKVFQNEELIIKILRCLNRIWKPKVTIIFEYRDLSFMDLTTLFGKLQEHKMELKMLVDNVEGDKKKSLALTTEEEKYSNSNEYMTLLVLNFKRFMKHDKE